MSIDRQKLYSEHYYYELNRREKLGAELSLPIGIITLMLGSISYFLQKFNIVTNSIVLMIPVLKV